MTTMRWVRVCVWHRLNILCICKYEYIYLLGLSLSNVLSWNRYLLFHEQMHLNWAEKFSPPGYKVITFSIHMVFHHAQAYPIAFYTHTHILRIENVFSSHLDTSYPTSNNTNTFELIHSVCCFYCHSPVFGDTVDFFFPSLSPMLTAFFPLSLVVMYFYLFEMMKGVSWDQAHFVSICERYAINVPRDSLSSSSSSASPSPPLVW